MKQPQELQGVLTFVYAFISAFCGIAFVFLAACTIVVYASPDGLSRLPSPTMQFVILGVVCGFVFAALGTLIFLMEGPFARWLIPSRRGGRPLSLTGAWMAHSMPFSWIAGVMSLGGSLLALWANEIPAALLFAGAAMIALTQLMVSAYRVSAGFFGDNKREVVELIGYINQVVKPGDGDDGDLFSRVTDEIRDAVQAETSDIDAGVEVA